MKTRLILVSSLAVPAALSQTSAAADAATAPRNRFFVNGRVGLNLKVDFRDTAATAARFVDPGPPTTGGVTRNYDNGFVGVDSSGNAGGTTWNWGYDHPDQYVPASDLLGLHAGHDTGSDLGRRESADPQPGVSLGYTRMLGRRGTVDLGVSVIAGWMDLSADSSATSTHTFGGVDDYYALGGVVPPTAPYRGNAAGPGPLLPDVPTYRLSSGDTATRSVNRSLDGSLWNLQLGPTAELALCRHASLGLGAGLSLALLDADLRTTYSVTDSSGTTTTAGSNRDTVGRVGAYVRGQVSVWLSEAWSVFGGAQWQYFDEFDLTHNTTRAEVSLREGFEAFLGVGYAF